MVKLEDFDFKGMLPVWKVYVNDIPTICVPLGALSSTLLSILKCNPSAELMVELYRDEILKPCVVTHDPNSCK